jgi:hypothetical protein
MIHVSYLFFNIGISVLDSKIEKINEKFTVKDFWRC